MNPSIYLTNLFAYSLQVGVLVGIGTLLARAFKIRHPGILLLHWRLLLLVCLLLPAIQPWNRPAEHEFLLTPHKTTRVQITLGPAFGGSDRFPAYELLAWILASGIGLRWTWLILGLLRLGHYRRKARLLDPLPPTVEEMQAKVGVAPRVYLSGELDSPVIFGMWPPVMLLPYSFPEMQPILQKAIACHELWHIRRRDWILTLLEEFLAAPFWFHPAVWWLLDQLQLCREQVVDRLVLKTTQERKPYLEALLQTALAQRRPKFTPAPLFLSRHHLTQRVVSILREVSMSKTRLIASLVSAWLILFLTGELAVQVFPLESAGMPESQSAVAVQPDHASPVVVTQELLSKRLVHQVKPTYPPEAKQLGIQGEVDLEVSVNEKGEVSNIRVVKGHALLVLSALNAVKQWKYAPYLVDGVAVPVTSTVLVTFTLADTGSAAAKKDDAPLIRLHSEAMATNLIYRVEPIYPLEAKQKGIAGDVVFEVTINEQGEVSDVQVLSGNAMLVSAAYEAVRQWRYTPVLLNGDPIRAKSTVTIQFELEKDKPTASASPQDSRSPAIPNPAGDVTPQEHSRRIAYANERFVASDKPGSQTDRGRIYLTWGPPDEIESHPDAATTYPFEIWRYRNLGGKPDQRDVQLEFVGTDYKLVRREGAAR
jgi:TonB family protein